MHSRWLPLVLALLTAPGLLVSELAAQSEAPPSAAAADPCAAAAAASRDSLAPVDIEPAPQQLSLLKAGAPKDAAGRPVVLRFLVTAEGRVDTASVAAEGTDDAKWLSRARRELARARFDPAELGHCRVPRWINLNFRHVQL